MITRSPFSTPFRLSTLAKLADLAMQLLVGQDAFVARLALPDDRGLVPARPLQMPIEAIFARRSVFRRRTISRTAASTRAPSSTASASQFAGLARPEFFRLTDRFPVHSSVMVEAANTGFFGKITRGLEDAGFLEVGLDVLFHEGNGTLTSGSGALNEKFIARREFGERTRLVCGRRRPRRRKLVRDRSVAAGRKWHAPARRSSDGMRGTGGCASLLSVVILLGSPMVCGMSDHVYKKLELVGSSTTTIEDAVQNALSLAAKTIRNMRWFEVIEMRGHIEENKINHWQVTVKVGFTLER